VAGQTSLDGWVRYFMSGTTHIDSEICGDAPPARLSLPNVYFTLNCPLVTIIGTYTNVPDGGRLTPVQQQWLTNEFQRAPEEKAMILALHHPVYSFDDHHSGSPAMADAVQHAINDSRRVPNMVLTAHVHNYQRIERHIAGETPTPFIVAGAGGYYHRHGVTADTGHVDHDLGAQLMFHAQYHHSYLTLAVDKDGIAGVMTRLPRQAARSINTMPSQTRFAIPTKLTRLLDGVTVSL
jgi:hypothetical protein